MMRIAPLTVLIGCVISTCIAVTITLDPHHVNKLGQCLNASWCFLCFCMPCFEVSQSFSVCKLVT